MEERGTTPADQWHHVMSGHGEELFTVAGTGAGEQTESEDDTVTAGVIETCGTRYRHLGDAPNSRRVLLHQCNLLRQEIGNSSCDALRGHHVARMRRTRDPRHLPPATRRTLEVADRRRSRAHPRIPADRRLPTPFAAASIGRLTGRPRSGTLAGRHALRRSARNPPIDRHRGRRDSPDALSPSEPDSHSPAGAPGRRRP